jgi:hypothetical protein
VKLRVGFRVLREQKCRGSNDTAHRAAYAVVTAEDPLRLKWVNGDVS